MKIWFLKNRKIFVLATFLFTSTVFTQEYSEQDILLSMACIFGNAEQVKNVLHEFKLDVNKPDGFGASPFYYALSCGCSEIISLLLEHGANFLEVHSPSASTSFHIISRTGDINALKLLISYLRSDEVRWLINKVDKRLAAPIHYAVEGQRVEMVKFLLANGADKYALDFHSNLPLHYATYNGNSELSKILLPPKTISWQSISRYEYLIKNPVIQLCGTNYINHPNLSGYTPLHYAAINGSVDLVFDLINKGGDATLKDPFGRNLIEIASDYKHSRLKELLLIYNARFLS